MPDQADSSTDHPPQRLRLLLVCLCCILLLPLPARALDEAVREARSNGIWVTTPGEHIRDIAARLLPESETLQAQLIAELRDSNAELFLDTERTRLSGGALLKLPDYALLPAGGEQVFSASRNADEAENALAGRADAAPRGLRASGADGQVRPLAEGDAIRYGETLLSGAESASVTLADGARLTLRPRSVVLIAAPLLEQPTAEQTDPQADAEQPSAVQALQLLRGGLRLMSSEPRDYLLQHGEAQLRLYSRQFSLRECRDACDDAAQFTAGLYGLSQDGLVQLNSPAGEQRFEPGLWFHLPNNGDPASTLAEAPQTGFDIPTAQTADAKASEAEQRIDAHKLRQMGQKLSAQVMTAISQPQLGLIGEPDASDENPFQAFLSAGGGRQLLSVSLGNGEAVETRTTRLRLPSAGNLPIFTPRTPPLVVPRYRIATPDLPLRGQEAVAALLLDSPRAPQQRDSLCYGGNCADGANAAPIIGPRRGSDLLRRQP